MDETVTTRLDDLEWAKGLRVDAVERVEFSIAGKHYQIDLGEQSVKDFTTALEPFVSVARQVDERGRPVTRRRRKSTDQGTRDNAQGIRTWAIEHGYTLAGRGRIPGAIRQAYQDHQAGAQVG